MSNPNSVQYGGDHYHKAGSAQHWDMLPMFGFGWEYYLGCATKYATRVKDRELDPMKSVHYIDKLIWLIDTGAVPPTRLLNGYRTVAELNRYLTTIYFPANNLHANSPEAQAIAVIMFAANRHDLQAARGMLQEIATSTPEAPDEPNVGYVNQDDRMFRIGDGGGNGNPA